MLKEKGSFGLFAEYCSSNCNFNKDIVTNELNLSTPFSPSTFESNTSSTLDDVNFGMEVLYPLSVKVQDVRYEKQSLVVLIFDEKTKFTSLTTSRLDVKKLKGILMIERSTQFQAYKLLHLNRCPHFTLRTVDLPNFIKAFEDYLHEPLNVTFVCRYVPFYSNDVQGSMVVNSSHNIDLSDKITSHSQLMFESGIAQYFTMQDQGRGDVIGDGALLSASLPNKKSVSVKIGRKDRSIPTLTCGYSNMDANRYKHNRYTILGNTKPFISNSGIPDQCKKPYLNYLKACMEAPFAKDAFDLESLSTPEKELRKDLLEDFYKNMSGDPNQAHDWFCNESITDVCVEQLAPHCDKQNSTLKGLETVLVFSCHPPISSLEVGNKRTNELELAIDNKSKPSFNLHDYVVSKGYSTTFPHTRVHYMKNIVDSYVKKRVDLQKIAEKDNLRKVTVWGLTETIGSPLDYRGTIFDNASFPKNFQDNKQNFNQAGSIVKGEHLKVVASFDKIGYFSILLEIWNLLVLDFFPNPTVLDAIEFGFYCIFTCNGTSLPWRIALEIHEHINESRELYKVLGSTFLMLKHTDSKVSLQQNLEKPGEVRKIGHCTDNRSGPSEEAMNYEWNHKSKPLIEVINVAFFNHTHTFEDENLNKAAKEKSGREFVEHFLCSWRGIDAFYCNSYLTFLSFMGIIPLKEYPSSTISSQWSNKSGPIKLAYACTDANERKKKKPPQLFDEIRKEINRVVGQNLFTSTFQENQYCETWRTYASKIEKLGKPTKDVKTFDFDILKDNSKIGSSKKNDIYFWMPQKNNIQNVFLFTTSSRGFTPSKPGLLIRSSLDWESGPITFTDWGGAQSQDNHKSPNLLHWHKEGKSQLFSPSTKLIIHDSLRTLYHPGKKPTSPPKKSQQKSRTKRTKRKTSSPDYYGKTKKSKVSSDHFNKSVCNLDLSDSQSD